MNPSKMKFLLFRKFTWVILFSLIHLWFMVFNWQLFITMLNINLGFAVVRLPPFVVLALTGFVMLAIQSWTGYVNKLHRIIHGLETELARQHKEDRQHKDRPPYRKDGFEGRISGTNPTSAKSSETQGAATERNPLFPSGKGEDK